MRLAYHQIATLQTVLVGKGSKLLHRALVYKITRQLHHVLIRGELRTVVVGIVEGILKYKSRHGSLLVIGSHSERVLSHKDVGRDAATSIYHTSDACMISRTCVLDAVLREELSMLVACEQVVLVVLVVARHKRLLNAAS